MSETEALGDVEAPGTVNEEGFTKNAGDRSLNREVKESGSGASKIEEKGQSRDVKMDEINDDDIQKIKDEGQGTEEDAKTDEVKDEDDQEKRGCETKGKEDLVEESNHVRAENGKGNDLQEDDKKASESEETTDIKDDEKAAEVQEGEGQKVNQMVDTEATKSMNNENNEENVHLAEVKEIQRCETEAKVQEKRGRDEIKDEDMQKIKNEGQGTEEDVKMDKVKDEDDQEKRGSETEGKEDVVEISNDVRAEDGKENDLQEADKKVVESEGTTDAKDDEKAAEVQEGEGQKVKQMVDTEAMKSMNNENNEENVHLAEVKEIQRCETEVKVQEKSGRDEVKDEDIQKIKNEGQGTEEDAKMDEVKDEDDQEKRGSETEGKEDAVEKLNDVRAEDGKENDLQEDDKKAVESEGKTDIKDDEKEAEVQEGEGQNVKQMFDTEATKSMNNENNEENVHLAEVKEMDDLKHVSDEEEKGTEDKEKKHEEPENDLNEEANSVKEEESKEQEYKNIANEKQKQVQEEKGKELGEKERNKDQVVKAEMENMEKTEGEKEVGCKKAKYDNGQERTETAVQKAQEEDENKKGQKPETALQQEKVGREDKMEIDTYEKHGQKQGHAEQKDYSDEDNDMEDKGKEEQDEEEDKMEEDKDEEDETHKEDIEKYGGDGGDVSQIEGEEAKVKQNGTKRKRSKGRRGAGKGEQHTEHKIEDIFRSPTPSSSERPHRERKTVERLVETIERGPKKLNFQVEKGQGTPLKDIANVAYKLAKMKPRDIQFLHQLLFGKKGKAADYRNHILLFSGFMWHVNEDKQRLKMKEKLDKFVKQQLFDVCKIFDLPVSRATSRKEDLVVKLLEFMASPCATSDVLLAEKEQHAPRSTKRKRYSGGSTSRLENSSEKRSRTRLLEGEGAPNLIEGTSGSEDEAGAKSEKKDSDSDHFNEDRDEKGSESEKENGSREEEEDDEVEDSKEQKTKKAKRERSVRRVKSKKVTPPMKAITPERSPQKTSSKGSKDVQKNEAGRKFFSRKKKVDEVPIIKSHPKSDSKAKPAGKIVGKGNVKNVEVGGPSNAELKEKICEILKEVDFNTATFTDILKQLATHFKTDLITRKEHIKHIIQDELTRLAEAEEEDSEADENSAKNDNVGSARKGVEA